MNIIIVIEHGILRNPILIKNNITAQATFNSVVIELLGDDVSEIDLHSDSCVDDVNALLGNTGVEVHWFVDIKVNKYKN